MIDWIRSFALTWEGTVRAKGNPVPIPEPGSGTVPIRALIRGLVGVTRNDPEKP